MTKKLTCKVCNVPLEGLGYKLIARPLFGVKLSTKKKGVCNKCENKGVKG